MYIYSLLKFLFYTYGKIFIGFLELLLLLYLLKNIHM